LAYFGAQLGGPFCSFVVVGRHNLEEMAAKQALSKTYMLMGWTVPSVKPNIVKVKVPRMVFDDYLLMVRCLCCYTCLCISCRLGVVRFRHVFSLPGLHFLIDSQECVFVKLFVRSLSVLQCQTYLHISV